MNAIEIVLLILLCLDIAVHMDSSKAYINGFKDSMKILNKMVDYVQKDSEN